MALFSSEEEYLDVFQQVYGIVKGQKVYDHGLMVEDVKARHEMYDTILQAQSEGAMAKVFLDNVYKVKPVSIDVFIQDPYFLDKKGVVYPKVLEALKELNSGKYIECVLTGGIGAAKTFIAHYTMAYQLYVLSCMRSPHSLFGLDPATEILFVFQTLSYTLSKNLEFNRFKALIEGSPYFTEQFQFDKTIESRLKFPHRIEVVPVSGEETGTIGQNVMSAVLDEVNYMAVVDKSKSAVEGGLYDQAWALYNSIARRRKSRFIVGGKTYGMLCLVSSKRYPDQFTDLKEREALDQLRKTGKTGIYVYDKCAWDVKPAGTYATRGWFKVFIGDKSRRPRVLDAVGHVGLSKWDIENLVIDVPGDYRNEFDKDITNALREVAGVSTMVSHPYMSNVDAVSKCFGVKQSVFNATSAVVGTGELKILKNVVALGGSYPRFAHIDLSVSGDRTGVCIGHVRRFKTFTRYDDPEILPVITIDGALAIKPPQYGEIDYGAVRNILYVLRNMGMPIKWVTFDSYQSVDSQQILIKKGFITGRQSMDTTIAPYKLLQAALYDGRVECSQHEILLTELLGLEYDPKTGKVDHRANGSKDVADGLAGVVTGLTMRREIWLAHDIPLDQIPPSISEVISEEDTMAQQL